MSWVAWKQRHLWSGALRTTCYSSGWSYYNCRCWAKTWFCWVILEYFHLIRKKYVFQLVSFKNTSVYSFLWIAIHWVCRNDTNRSDKISMHCDALVNRIVTPLLYNMVGRVHDTWSCYRKIIWCCLHSVLRTTWIVDLFFVILWFKW